MLVNDKLFNTWAGAFIGVCLMIAGLTLIIRVLWFLVLGN